MSEFNHAAHVKLALEYLTASPSLDVAIARMAETVRGKAEAAGHPEKYHHTVTVFWMQMVSRLLDKDLPLVYYSPERLANERARTEWLEPDLRPLD